MHISQAYGDRLFQTAHGSTLGHRSASADNLRAEISKVLANNRIGLELRDRNGRTMLRRCALVESPRPETVFECSLPVF